MSVSSADRPSGRTGRVVQFGRQALFLCGRELAETVALIAVLLLLTVLFQHALAPRAGLGFWADVWNGVIHAGQDRNGRPIGPQFVVVCRETLPLVIAALGWLTVLSCVCGSLLVLIPATQWLRGVILLASTIPCFLWPVLCFGWWSDRPFQGLDEFRAWGWPALFLAIGDMNWLTGTTAVSEAVRDEISRPHWRLSRTLGLSAARTLAPRLAVAMLNLLAARLPHLLGGAIVLEFFFRLRGLGQWTWNAAVESFDPAILVWIGAFGILTSRTLHWLASVASAWFFPSQHVHGGAGLLMSRSASDEDSVQDEFGEPEGVSPRTSLPTVPGANALQLANQNRVIRLAPAIESIVRDHLTGEVPSRPKWWSAMNSRLRFYRRVGTTNPRKVVLAVIMVAVFIGVLYGLGWHAMSAPRGVRLLPFQPPSGSLPLGSNAAGDDVAALLWKGWWQQLPAWGACVLMLWLAVPLSLCRTADVLLEGVWLSRLSRVARVVIGLLLSVLEATPKLVWLLACFALFRREGMVLKLSLAMGILFLPQLARALAEELSFVRHSLFLEALRVARVPRRRWLWDNIVMARVWPVVCSQTALIHANVVLTEAWLGYLGVRNRSEIFTWGSLLGTGVDEFVQMRPLAAFGQPFNDAVVWGPLVCLSLAIGVCQVCGQGMRVLTGSALWRWR